MRFRWTRPGGREGDALMGTARIPMTRRIRRMLIDPIESVEGAESIIADAALAFTAYGALQLMVGIFIVIRTGAITVLAIGALIPCVAYLLKQTNSRVLAGVLWMYMGAELIARAWIIDLPNTAARISGLLLPAVMALVGYGTVRAALRFHALRRKG